MYLHINLHTPVYLILHACMWELLRLLMSFNNFDTVCITVISTQIYLASVEGQNEEENKKIRKIDQNLRKKSGKWNSCPPGTVKQATALFGLIFKIREKRFHDLPRCPTFYENWEGCVDFRKNKDSTI